MATNPNPSQLDATQIAQRTFDATNDAVRVEVGGGTSFALSLDATSGDTVGVQSVGTMTKTSITTSNTGTILGPISCVGMNVFNLYTNTTADITSAQLLTLQVSPHDTDNVWISTSLTITPSTSHSSSPVVAGTANTPSSAAPIVGRRVRVITAAAIGAGTYDLYLVAQG